MLIAISQRSDKNKHGNPIDSLENNYVNFLESFGLQLIPISNSTKDIEFYFKDLPIVGIILSGGNDVNPELYGESFQEELACSDQRDETEKELLRLAITKKLPVLGICRGMQFINVYFQGKLININSHVGQGHVAKNHLVNILNQEAKDLLGEKIETNSYHNQGIDPATLSPELKSFAQTADGIIEGIYHPALPIAGIVWHPERPNPDPESNKKIINAFLKRELFWQKNGTSGTT